MPRRPSLANDERGRIQYVDAVLSFANLVAFAAMIPWLYQGIGMATNVVDPLSSVLLQLTTALFVIGMIVSIGVSARTG